jgi:quercetin dioxygenase-like cupin family protein
MRTLVKCTLAAFCVTAFSTWAVEQPAPTASRANVLLTKKLAGMEGKEGAMLTVEVPPGAESPAHRHNADTFVYMIEGSMVMQVQGGQPVTLKAGQTFYESPSDIHTVSRNASLTEPAKFVVFMVKAAGTPLTEPVK